MIITGPAQSLASHTLDPAMAGHCLPRAGCTERRAGLAHYGFMPTTFTGLLLFLVLLVPGFVYVATLRRSRPVQRLSVFQETASVAISSAAAITLGLAVFAGFRTWLSHITPDVGRWMQEGSEYAKQEYALIAWWVFGVMALATVIAALAGSAAAKWMPVHTSIMSSWWALFDNRRRKRQVEVGCGLDDGTYIQGILKSYSRVSDDTEDRDLILRPPIFIRLSGRKKLQPYENISAVCLSAHRIVWMTAGFIETPESQQELESAQQKHAKRKERFSLSRLGGRSDSAPKVARSDQPAADHFQ